MADGRFSDEYRDELALEHPTGLLLKQDHEDAVQNSEPKTDMEDVRAKSRSRRKDAPPIPQRTQMASKRMEEVAHVTEDVQPRS